ncbi:MULTISPECIES: diaminopimelate epimerase [unclassified Clostridium]|uniref:diaminopimelate epimerase n=1 Tax=unclassified Clostridium TaxID=2614128 RepID=UPI00321741CC
MEILKFTKMQGAGNNFVVFEDMEVKYNDLGTLAKKLCDRNFGIGGDGILVVRRSKIADIQMIIINSDGSYAGMCGNGIRCFAKYVYENNMVRKSEFTVETGDGIKVCHLFIEDNKVKAVKINMGRESFNPKFIPALGEEEIIKKDICANGKSYNITSLLLGVPHTVLLTEEGGFKVEEGAAIETHELFPQGTNVNFCRVVNREEIKVNTWERGAGPTLACGTGCCSSVVVCNKLNLVDKSVKVMAPGGILTIEITEDGIMMTGPAENVFKGEIAV